MLYLLPCYALVSMYCGAYALHCFRKRHVLPALTATILALLPIACGILLLYL